ncbi:hypothetical protein FA329_25805, partial [Pseudomonas aeruginosa]|nr:hypothetical protein [Pseudomonas aeruginosa]
MQADFWHARWANNQIGFHLDEINPYLMRHLSRLRLQAGERILVPLCGKTLDLAWLAAQGLEVLGVELSERLCLSYLLQWSKLNRDLSQHEGSIMKAVQFSRWMAQLSSLNPEQRDQLRSKLLPAARHWQDAIKAPSHCPHCQSRELRPWGSSGDLPRYRCKVCGKTSNALTGTPMARLRKRHLWQDYADALTQSLSVRKA